MTRKPTALFAAAILGGLVTTTAVLAEENTPTSPPPRAAQGMTGDHGMMNMMGQMSPDQMKQMTRMVDGCNRMMESMSGTPTGPDKNRAPDHPG